MTPLATAAPGPGGGLSTILLLALPFAVLLYLWRRNDAVWYRVLVAGAAAVSVASVIASGSRAGAAVVAGLVVMIPFVERSAVKGFVLAVLGALGILGLPFVVGQSGEGTAIARLAGSVDAIGADQARSRAQDFGIDLFLQHPFVGNGFADAIYVHNVVLGVASSAGIIGLIGYLMVLYTLARPIIGTHPNRRLSYVAWAFIAITPTFPGLDDRTLWVPLAPVILLAVQTRFGGQRPSTADGDDGADGARADGEGVPAARGN